MWDSTFISDRVSFIQSAADDLKAQPGYSNVIAVGVEPFDVAGGDWNIPHDAAQVTAWQNAGYTTSKMLGSAEAIINAEAAYFPTLNIKLGFHPGSSSLDSPITGDLPDPNYPPQGVNDPTDSMYLAYKALDWAYAMYPNNFYAEIADLTSNGTPNYDGACYTTVPSVTCSTYYQAEYSLLSYFRSQGYGVGLQNIDAALNGSLASGPLGIYCRQYGTRTQWTCTPCDSANTSGANADVSYTAVTTDAWNVASSYGPRFWEIWPIDAETTNQGGTDCQITSGDATGMQSVFTFATQAMQKQ